MTRKGLVVLVIEEAVIARGTVGKLLLLMGDSRGTDRLLTRAAQKGATHLACCSCRGRERRCPAGIFTDFWKIR